MEKYQEYNYLALLDNNEIYAFELDEKIHRSLLFECPYCEKSMWPVMGARATKSAVVCTNCSTIGSVNSTIIRSQSRVMVK